MKSLSLQLLSLSLVTTTALGFSSAAIAQTTQTTSQQQLQIAQAEETIVGVASGDETFSTLVSAVEAAELVETLQGEGPFTVFAPTNEAFDALPQEVVAFLVKPDNQDLLQELLTYHVVEGNVMSTDLETGIVNSLEGELAVGVSQEGVTVNEANVIQADVEASNGTIHVIDKVLMPEGFLESIEARMGTDMEAAEAADMEAEMDSDELEVDTEASDTEDMEAEMDSDELEAAPEASEAEDMEAEMDSDELEADTEASEAEDMEAEMDSDELEADTEAGDTEMETPNLVALASNEEELSTLVAAVEAAGLVETLQGEGPFTIFAPTNAAFEALPEGVLEFLLQPENQDLLERILTYHVVEGNVMSTDLETGSIEALGGGIAIDVSEDGVKINNANVIQADVEASNGTVHVIDTVLAPAGFLQTIEERMN